MNRDIVRLVVGVGVIVAHVIAFFGVIVWKSSYIPSSQERLDVAMVLIPVSAAYVVAVVRSAIQNQAIAKDIVLVNGNYVAIVLLITLSFCGALLFFVFSYPKVVGPTIVELRRWLVVVEIGVGGAFGLITEDLFGKVERILVPRETGTPAVTEKH